MKLEEYLQLHYKGESVKSYNIGIRKYLENVKNAENAEIKEILYYIKELRKQDYSPKTLQTKLAYIKAYYNYLQQTGIRKDHPCKNLQLKDKIDKSIQTEKLYTEKQLEEYLEQTPKHKKLMVSLLVYQGLTIQEIATVRPENINLEKAEIYLSNRTLKLKAQQIYLLIEHFKTFKENRIYVFEHIRKQGHKLRAKWINHYINYGRKEKYTPIKIRQSVIKNLLTKHDLRKVQVFAGHKKSSITQSYKTSDFEQLKNEIQHLHPLNRL